MIGRSTRLMVVAGEPSGDLHAGRLLGALREKIPSLQAFGMGGAVMREAGAEVIHDIGALAVTGLGGVPRLIPRLRRIRRDLLGRVRRERPDAVILVDYPGFNLALARALQKVPGVGKRVYFIPPQVWAWWGGRARAVAAHFDLTLTIFPFEPAYFTRHGGRAEFVGNPVAHGLRDAPDRTAARASLGIGPDRRVVALLPGSRPKEVARHLAPMVAAARLLHERWPEALFLLSEAEGLPAGAVSLAAGEGEGWLRAIRGRVHEMVRAADAAVVASGTASLETGLLGTPMVVLYRGDWLSYFLAKYFVVQVDYLSLVNLLAGREVARELYQRRVNPTAIASALRPLLEEPGPRREQIEAFARIRRLLAGPDPYERAAARIARLLETGE